MSGDNSPYTPLARALAQLALRRAAPPGRALLADMAARLALAQTQGHVCLALDAVADDGTPALSGAPWPAPAQAAQLLSSSDWVSADGTTPYVLDGSRLYTQEYFFRECRTAARLKALACAQTPMKPAQAAALARVFPEGGDPGQREAARAILQRRLVMVTGGPGTGKTYTLARALALLLAEGDIAPEQVALCAPTGRGAARLGETLHGQLPEVFSALGRLTLENLPRAHTLHRLLGIGRGAMRPTYHADRPLPHRLVIVDESSMMDFLLFDSLLDALSPQARLILVGDPHQLSSVGAGNVLADLMAGLPQACAPLRVNHRFGAGAGVGALCEAVLSGAGAPALRALESDAFAWTKTTPAQADVAQVLEGYRAFAQADSAPEALERLSQFRILSAFNEGEWGIDGINRLAEDLFAGARAIPVLVDVNLPALDLYNGDTGLCWKPTGQLWFPGKAQPLDGALVGRVSPCWAMTIHRAQGSEFGGVCVMLGGGPASERAQGILTRELLYTAISRARTRVQLLGTPAQVAAALGRGVARASGLAGRLA